MTFEELLNISELYEKFSKHDAVKSIIKNLSFKTELIGLIRDNINKIVCLEGNHRAVAVALVQRQGKQIDFSKTGITIVLTHLPKSDIFLLNNMLQRGSINKKYMKFLLLGAVLLMLIMPTAIHAFSFSDLLWWRNKEVIQEQAQEKLNVNQRAVAQSKLAIWVKAYNENNLSLIASDDRYLTISEEELNFILQEQLDGYDNPPIQDVEISLGDGRIIFEGYALKPLKGNAYVELRIEVMERQLYFHVIKARYKGMPIPGSLVGRLLYKYLEPVSDFFLTNNGVKLQDIMIDGKNINFVID